MKNDKNNTPKLSAFERKVVKALEHIFTVEGWEIPDSAVEGKLSAKVRELESRLNSITQTPAVNRIDAVTAMGATRKPADAPKWREWANASAKSARDSKGGKHASPA